MAVGLSLRRASLTESQACGWWSGRWGGAGFLWASSLYRGPRSSSSTAILSRRSDLCTTSSTVPWARWESLVWDPPGIGLELDSLIALIGASPTIAPGSAKMMSARLAKLA